MGGNVVGGDVVGSSVVWGERPAMLIGGKAYHDIPGYVRMSDTAYFITGGPPRPPDLGPLGMGPCILVVH